MHTDSESDGSEDLEEADILDKCVRRSTPQSGIDVGLSSDVCGQHAVADDVDFQRVFPTADSMARMLCPMVFVPRISCHQLNMMHCIALMRP